MVPLPVIGPLASALGVGVNNNQSSKTRGVAVMNKAPMNQPWAAVVSGQRSTCATINFNNTSNSQTQNNTSTSATTNNNGVCATKNSKLTQDSFFPPFFSDLDQPKVFPVVKSIHNSSENFRSSDQNVTFNDKESTNLLTVNPSFKSNERSHTFDNSLSPRSLNKVISSKNNNNSFSIENDTINEDNPYIKHGCFTNENKNAMKNPLVYQENQSYFSFDSLNASSKSKNLLHSRNIPPPPPPDSSDYTSKVISEDPSVPKYSLNVSNISSLHSVVPKEQANNSDNIKKIKNPIVTKSNSNILDNYISPVFFNAKRTDDSSGIETYGVEELELDSSNEVTTSSNALKTDNDEKNISADSRNNLRSDYCSSNSPSWRVQNYLDSNNSVQSEMVKDESPSLINRISRYYSGSSKGKKSINMPISRNTSHNIYGANAIPQVDNMVNIRYAKDWRNRDMNEECDSNMPSLASNMKQPVISSEGSLNDETNQFISLSKMNSRDTQIDKSKTSFNSYHEKKDDISIQNFFENDNILQRNFNLPDYNVSDMNTSGLDNTNNRQLLYHSAYNEMTNQQMNDAIPQKYKTKSKSGKYRSNQNKPDGKSDSIGNFYLNQSNNEAEVIRNSYNNSVLTPGVQNKSLNEDLSLENSDHASPMNNMSNSQQRMSKERLERHYNVSKSSTKLNTLKNEYHRNKYSPKYTTSIGADTTSEGDNTRTNYTSRLVSNSQQIYANNNYQDQKPLLSSLPKSEYKSVNDYNTSPMMKQYSTQYDQYSLYSNISQSNRSNNNALNVFPCSSYLMQPLSSQDGCSIIKASGQVKDRLECDPCVSHDEGVSLSESFNIGNTGLSDTNPNHYYFASNLNFVVNPESSNLENDDMQNIHYQSRLSNANELKAMSNEIKSSNDRKDKSNTNTNVLNKPIVYNQARISQQNTDSSVNAAAVNKNSIRGNPSLVYTCNDQPYYQNKGVIPNYLWNQQVPRLVNDGTLVTQSSHSDSNIGNRNPSQYTSENQCLQHGVSLSSGAILHDMSGASASGYNQLDPSQSLKPTNTSMMGSGGPSLMVMLPSNDDISCYQQHPHPHRYSQQAAPSVTSKGPGPNTYYYYADPQSNNQIRQPPTHLQSLDLYNHQVSGSTQYSFIPPISQDFTSSQNPHPAAHILPGFYQGYHPPIYERTIGRLHGTNTAQPSIVSSSSGYHGSILPPTSGHIPLVSNTSIVQSSMASIPTQQWSLQNNNMISMQIPNNVISPNHDGSSCYSRNNLPCLTQDGMQDVGFPFDHSNIGNDSSGQTNLSRSPFILSEVQHDHFSEYSSAMKNNPLRNVNESSGNSKMNFNQSKKSKTGLSEFKLESPVTNRVTTQADNKHVGITSKKSRSGRNDVCNFLPDTIPTQYSSELSYTRWKEKINKSTNKGMNKVLDSYPSNISYDPLENENEDNIGNYLKTCQQIPSYSSPSNTFSDLNLNNRHHTNSKSILNPSNQSNSTNQQVLVKKNTEKMRNVHHKKDNESNANEFNNTSKYSLRRSNREDGYSIPRDVCRHYLLGRCTYSDCNFSHSEDALLHFNMIHNNNKSVINDKSSNNSHMHIKNNIEPNFNNDLRTTARRRNQDQNSIDKETDTMICDSIHNQEDIPNDITNNYKTYYFGNVYSHPKTRLRNESLNIPFNKRYHNKKNIDLSPGTHTLKENIDYTSKYDSMESFRNIPTNTKYHYEENNTENSLVSQSSRLKNKNTSDNIWYPVAKPLSKCIVLPRSDLNTGVKDDIDRGHHDKLPSTPDTNDSAHNVIIVSKYEGTKALDKKKTRTREKKKNILSENNVETHTNKDNAKRKDSAKKVNKFSLQNAVNDKVAQVRNFRSSLEKTLQKKSSNSNVIDLKDKMMNVSVASPLSQDRPNVILEHEDILITPNHERSSHDKMLDNIQNQTICNTEGKANSLDDLNSNLVSKSNESFYHFKSQYIENDRPDRQTPYHNSRGKQRPNRLPRKSSKFNNPIHSRSTVECLNESTMQNNNSLKDFVDTADSSSSDGIIVFNNDLERNNSNRRQGNSKVHNEHRKPKFTVDNNIQTHISSKKNEMNLKSELKSFDVKKSRSKHSN